MVLFSPQSDGLPTVARFPKMGLCPDCWCVFAFGDHDISNQGAIGCPECERMISAYGGYSKARVTDE